MLNKIFGSSFILIGFLWFIFTYKNTKKVDINFIFYNNSTYYKNPNCEVINKDKFLKLQKIKYLISGICYISIGLIGLLWYSKCYLLGFLPMLISFIFSLIGKKHVKFKSLNSY